MALRHFDGFDFYATADLASRYNVVTGGLTVNPTAGRFGTGALCNSPAGGNEVVAKFFDEQPTWVVGFVYKTGTSGYATLLCNLANEKGNQVELRLDSSNHLVLTANGTVLATGTTTLLPNNFYYLEFKATITQTQGSCQARIGGVSEMTATGVNTDPQKTGTASRVGLWYENFRTTNLYDDFYVLDGTGAHNNDFLGDMRVETILPNAEGQFADFTITGAATAHQAVNEVIPNGDTSYLASASVGAEATFRFPNLVSDPTRIAGMQLIAIARKDDAGSRAIKHVVRIAGTDYLGPELGVPDTYVYLSSLFEDNPATGQPWTGAQVNGVEAGFTITR